MEGTKYVWMNGKIIEWDDATVHVSAPIVQYGAGVFEGIRGYWEPEENELNIFGLRKHINRLFKSAAFHRMKIPFSREDAESAIITIVKKNGFKEDVYIRPIVYRGGEWSLVALEGTPTEISIFPIRTPRPERMKKMTDGIKCCVSSWRKISDSAMPPRIKTCGNYVGYLNVRMEAHLLGFDDAILLTANGKVSEATAANLFLRRGTILITPSVTEDIIEGVTRDLLITLAKEELGMEVLERTVDKTELYYADEVFVCSTAVEVTPVISIDHFTIGEGIPGEVTMKMLDLYFKVVIGKIPKYRNLLTPVYQT